MASAEGAIVKENLQFNSSAPFIMAGCEEGLANRLRVLSAYLHVARALHGKDCAVVMVWDVNNACPGHFLELFAPLDNVVFITSSMIPLFKDHPALKRDYGSSAMGFREIVWGQNDIQLYRYARRKDGSFWRQDQHYLQARLLGKFKVKKHILDKVFVYIKNNNICEAEAMHVRSTDHPARSNTWNVWVTINSTEKAMFMMTDNPTVQLYYRQEFPRKLKVYEEISQMVKPNHVVALSEKDIVHKNNFVYGFTKSDFKELIVDLNNATVPSAISHIAMSNEERSVLPSMYRYTTLEHTLIDVLISAHAHHFHPSGMSSLSELVVILRRMGARRCKSGRFRDDYDEEKQKLVEDLDHLTGAHDLEPFEIKDQQVMVHD